MPNLWRTFRGWLIDVKYGRLTASEALGMVLAEWQRQAQEGDGVLGTLDYVKTPATGTLTLTIKEADGRTTTIDGEVVLESALDRPRREEATR